MKTLAKAIAFSAAFGIAAISAPANAWWGPWGGNNGGPWGNNGYGNNWNDWMGDGNGWGDFNMNMSGGGRGWGRNRYYDSYNYAPYYGAPYGYGYAPYYGAPYGAPAPYGYAPVAPAAPAAPAEAK